MFRSEEVLSFFSDEGITWKFTTALAPWQGGFYERLVSLVKQGLRKGIGHRLSYWDKLLAEVEAIINTHPLTYVYGDFLSGFTLTPAHFLTGNLDTVIPFNCDDHKDIEYQPKKDSAQDLADHWEKSKKQLDKFWEVWRQDYLLTLRETIPLFDKSSRSSILRQPRIGEIVLVKDENLPRRTWKMALIKEFIFSKDGEIRSVIIQLPNKQLVSRAINHLFPLEIRAVDHESEDVKTSSDKIVVNAELRSDSQYAELRGDSQYMRKAAVQARKRIADQLNDQAVTIAFSFPQECHGAKT